MTSAKNGDMHNVNVALASGANINVRQDDKSLRVSILIIVYVLLTVLVFC